MIDKDRSDPEVWAKMPNPALIPKLLKEKVKKLYDRIKDPTITVKEQLYEVIEELDEYADTLRENGRHRETSTLRQVNHLLMGMLHDWKD